MKPAPYDAAVCIIRVCVTLGGDAPDPVPTGSGVGIQPGKGAELAAIAADNLVTALHAIAAVAVANMKDASESIATAAAQVEDAFEGIADVVQHQHGVGRAESGVRCAGGAD